MARKSWSVLCAGASLALAASALALPAASAGARPPPEFTNRILGTNWPDVLVGGSGRDLIEGRRGADVLYGRASPDKLVGGRGNDVLRLGPNGARSEWRDSGFGGPGDDRIYGGPGADVLVGGDGNDRLYSGSRGWGFSGGTSMEGGRGADVLVSSVEDKSVREIIMIAGPGPDRIIGSSMGEEDANPNEGADVVRTAGGDDIVWAENDGRFDLIDCGAGNDAAYFPATDGGADPLDVFLNCEYIGTDDGP